jgi:hypothetical protein
MEEKVVLDKLNSFVEKVEDSKRFEIAGTDKDEEVIVLSDTTKREGIYGRYIEVGVEEILTAPLKDVWSVIADNRKPIVLEGVTRIVGYYSRTNNWNKSKVGELRDRIISRADGGYGFNGIQGDSKAIDDALVVTNNLSLV